MKYFVINIDSSYNYAMKLENAKFDKLRFFLSGVLGLEKTSELAEDKPIDIFTRSFQSKKYNVVKFFLTCPLNPTYPWGDEDEETK